MDCFYENGLQFSCTRCSRCCRHVSGYVFLSKSDIVALHTHIDMSEEEFLNEYCRAVDYGQEVRISLKEKANFDCIFWSAEADGCQVYPVRPLQCQSYPFWSQILTPIGWKNEANSCPGINTGKMYSAQEIEEILKLREKNPFIILQKGKHHE
ncbi:MAG: YkgJ family cysteine cluster protein [Spirochaetia bacterium]